MDCNCLVQFLSVFLNGSINCLQASRELESNHLFHTEGIETMKIKALKIKKFHQFRNLNIDLTYPKGHEKEGQPLDKICIIGQSGTGKTTLLNIFDHMTYRAWLGKYNYKIDDFFNNVQLTKIFDDVEIDLSIGSNEEDSGVVNYYWNNQRKDGQKISFEEALVLQNEYLDKIKTHLIHYPVDLDYNIPELAESRDPEEDHKIYDFSVERAAEIWNIILSEIKKYQEQELKIRQDISKVAETSTEISEIQKAVLKLERWKKRFKNPVQDLAENCLNPILKNFSLRVKTDLDILKKEDIGFIKIIDSNGNEIPHSLWSTGTKQVILSLLPLYLLKPNKTIVLFDEPERSLYPDMQSLIIEFYLNLMKDCQFIIATHSPLIAASFEPWEIIELKFDSEGYVYRELYYDGENHINNYSIHPRYLTYELILKNVFDLKETGSRDREKIFTEFIEVKTELDVLKTNNKLNTKRGKELFKKFETYAKILGWESDL